MTAIGRAFDSRVIRVTYDRTIWLPAPRRVHREGGHLKMGWFVGADPHQIALHLLDGKRVVLLVIPPGMAPDPAHWAMQRSTELTNTLGPAEILRQTGSAMNGDALDRWSDEGGPAAATMSPAPASEIPV
jgi:hypothetical protein